MESIIVDRGSYGSNSRKPYAVVNDETGNAITLCRVADVRYKTFVFKKRVFSAWRIR
jgi:hypothetical protein